MQVDRRAMKRHFVLLSALAVVLMAGLLAGCGTRIDEERFKSLLTFGDVLRAATGEIKTESQFVDYKKIETSIDPEQLRHIRAYFGQVWAGEGRTRGVSFTLLEYDTTDYAQQSFAAAMAGDAGFKPTPEPVGDGSYIKEYYRDGKANLLIVRKGRVVFQILTAKSEDDLDPVAPENMERLARLVVTRLP
jgi:hypothetical protein